MDWSYLISTIALGFSLWVYIKHDKEIKSLEKEKLEREAAENKRAHFHVQYEWLSYHFICIQNNGKSTAKNIVINIESEKPLTFPDGTTQYFIGQLEETEESNSIPLIGGYQHAIKVKLTWDDESGNGVKQTVCLKDNGANEFMRM